MARAILYSLVLAMLSACASDYNPYVEEITSHGEVVQSAGAYSDPYDEFTYVAVSPYYPWGSVDYFYFGNHYYRTASSPAFYIGVSYWSPWYSPYYGPFYYPYHYAAWYPAFYPWSYPYYGYGYAWGWYGSGYRYRHRNYYGHSSWNDDHPGEGRGQRPGVPVANRGVNQKQGMDSSGMEQNVRQRETMMRERGWRSADQRQAVVRQISQTPANPASAATPAGPSAPVANARPGAQPRFSPPPAAPANGMAPQPATSTRSGPARSSAPVSRASYSRRGNSGAGRPDRDDP